MNATSYLRAASTARTRTSVRVGALGAVVAGFILAASPAHADRIEKHFPVQNKPKITVRVSHGDLRFALHRKVFFGAVGMRGRSGEN